MRTLTFDEKYEQIKRDSLYNGEFYTAVVTTGIFCKPTCRARKPNKENVLFYDSSEDAMKNGFRPCKICKPMDLEGLAPSYITDLIRELHQNIFTKITDKELKERGFEPNRVRRWFNKNHNMTFHGYQRLLRINQAYNNIEGGNSITKTAFAIGYSSLSGFNESWKKVFGMTPKDHNTINVIHITRILTDLGPMFACSFENKLCLLEFTDNGELEQKLQRMCKEHNATILPGKDTYLEGLPQFISTTLSQQKLGIQQLQSHILKHYIEN